MFTHILSTHIFWFFFVCAYIIVNGWDSVIIAVLLLQIFLVLKNIVFYSVKEDKPTFIFFHLLFLISFALIL